jgi:hypothetical protein
MKLINTNKNNIEVKLSTINQTNYLYLEWWLDDILDEMKDDWIIEVNNTEIPFRIIRKHITFQPTIRSYWDYEWKGKQWVVDYMGWEGLWLELVLLFKEYGETLEILSDKVIKKLSETKYDDCELFYYFNK